MNEKTLAAANSKILELNSQIQTLKHELSESLEARHLLLKSKEIEKRRDEQVIDLLKLENTQLTFRLDIATKAVKAILGE